MSKKSNMKRKRNQANKRRSQFNGRANPVASNDDRSPVKISKADYKFDARNDEQTDLSNRIEQNLFTFALGEAGTGKTHVAIAKAVEAYERGDIKKIVLARPAVEAGEKLGFLKGTAQEKIDPYMRPLYDELDKIVGIEKRTQLMQTGEVEIVPVGLMRGRTFNDCFIIMDEAQNTTREQMKMVLTRTGMNSRAVICGDTTQVDLEENQTSGLADAVKRFENKRKSSTINLVEVVRGEAAEIAVDAYSEDNQNTPKPATQRTIKSVHRPR